MKMNLTMRIIDHMKERIMEWLEVAQDRIVASYMENMVWWIVGALVVGFLAAAVLIDFGLGPR